MKACLVKDFTFWVRFGAGFISAVVSCLDWFVLKLRVESPCQIPYVVSLLLMYSYWVNVYVVFWYTQMKVFIEQKSAPGASLGLCK